MRILEILEKTLCIMCNHEKPCAAIVMDTGERVHLCRNDLWRYAEMQSRMKAKPAPKGWDSTATPPVAKPSGNAVAVK